MKPPGTIGPRTTRPAGPAGTLGASRPAVNSPGQREPGWDLVLRGAVARATRSDDDGPGYRSASQLHEQLCAARLRILTATEEQGTRHWLKVLATA